MTDSVGSDYIQGPGAMEKIVEEVPLDADKLQFWGAVQIYTEKPHVLNRKVCGSTNIWIGVIDKEYCTEKAVWRIITKVHQHSPGNITSLTESDHTELLKTALLAEGFQSLPKNEELNKEKDSNEPFSASEIDDASSWGAALNIPWQELSANRVVVAVIRKLHPKQLQKYIPRLELILLDGWRTSAVYISKMVAQLSSVPPNLNYSFTLKSSGLSFSVLQETDHEDKGSDGSITWLKTNVLPKLVKWASEVQEVGIKQDQGSLSLVNIQEYNQLYQKLKVKYGQPLVEKWPETTDPQKFVFEDVAIATYLILLWKKERMLKGITEYQTFVDLGCGNGVLVYILTGEGHKGLGIDLKKRHIWDMFSSDVKLQEGVVEPSDKHLFPEYDWLIGNHSDELTPWLPVIASKSSYTTRFFVIPCCAHDFDCKYRRKHAGISQYADYIKYVKEIGSVCGFQMWVDKLRIPSTKRVCLIGQERTYGAQDSSFIQKNIDDFIKVRNEANAKASPNEKSQCETACDGDLVVNGVEDTLWSANFKAREPVQPVRNCTRLKEDVKQDLIAMVVSILLEKKHIVEVDIGCSNPVSWDQGGRIGLSDLAKRIGQQQLAALKKECGGLQTLLRNHRHMFSMTQGEVGLQVPVPEWKAKVPRDKIKTKHCWFHLNHYQNCPLPASACIYAHGDVDLRKFVT